MKKIMFNDRYDLTKAALEGRKTMTRRIATFEGIRNPMIANVMSEGPLFGRHCLTDGTEKVVATSAYTLDEIVAVAQSYKDAGIDPHFLMFQPIKGSTYFAEMETEAMFTGGWNNKMFVRADLMPHQIRITDIKVERLQDISDEDCIKEGIEEDAPYYWVPVNYELPNWKELNEKVSDMYANNDGKIYPHFWDSPRKAFSALIDAVCGKGTWERNPWVFVYSFKLVK